MMRGLALGLLASVLIAGAASAEPTIELQGRCWFPDLRSNAIVSNSTLPATKFDLKKDLGVKDEAIPEGQLVWHISRKHEVRAGANFVTFNGAKTLTTAITINGTTYAIGVPVTSELKLNTYNVGWGYRFVDNGTVSLTSLLDVKIFDISGTVTGGGVTESGSITVPLPTIGLGLEARLPHNLALCAEVTGMSAGDYGHLVDAEFGLKYTPIRYFSIGGGYRWVDFKATDNNTGDRVVVSLDGPYLDIHGQF